MVTRRKHLSCPRRVHFEWGRYDTFAESWLRQKPLYDALLSSRPLQRLRRIRFLGAIDSFWETPLMPPRAHLSRFNHTVGVAYLMSRGSRYLGHNAAKTDMLVCAALLHDIGHGALSHSTEPAFERKLGLNHKTIGKRLILGNILSGLEIHRILEGFEVDPDNVCRTIDCAPCADENRLLANPINVDTIDGILRTMSFFEPEEPIFAPEMILEFAISPSASNCYAGDYFWNLKDKTYTRYISIDPWAARDLAITAALESCSSDISERDFLLTDDTFYRKFHPALRREQRNGRRTATESKFRPTRPRFRYLIDTHIEPTDPRNLERRYTKRSIALADA